MRRLLAVAPLCIFFSAAQAEAGRFDILPDPGATVTITTPGSYVLVDDVVMTAAVPCIVIAADDVTINLAEHVLSGNGIGTGGIVSSAGVTRSRVFGGTVRSMDGSGVTLGDAATVESLTVHDCSNWSIAAGSVSEIAGCLVSEPGGEPGAGAISVGFGSNVRGNRVGGGNLTGPAAVIDLAEGASALYNTVSSCMGSTRIQAISVGQRGRAAANRIGSIADDSMPRAAINQDPVRSGTHRALCPGTGVLLGQRV